ncbi:MAG: ABC transporter ATP-binding protein [Candidatus Heimdallarchaeota archaeon]|nr:MAG: ABC transporter ATP-binding protein [Candidatus Heimdallarchaeota archaeon]
MVSNFRNEISNMIDVSSVTKVFKVGKVNITVLDKLDFRCQENEFTIFTGPSGSGKSTILSIIGGLTRVDEGSVNIFNNKLEKMSEEMLALFRSTYVGFVFQTGHLINSLTVFENVMLPVELSQRDDTNFDERAWDLLKEFRLEDRADSLPVMISGGEYQRTAFVRALVLDPDILLIDEPTSNQDSQTTETIINKLRKLKSQRTIIVVTHDREIFPLANNIYYPVNGKLSPFKVE